MVQGVPRRGQLLVVPGPDEFQGRSNLDVLDSLEIAVDVAGTYF